MVRLRDFSVELGGRRVFDPITLSVAPGERVGLAGESGCGKTTILKALAGLLAAKAQGEMAAPEDVGYVPQESIESLSPYLTVLEQSERDLLARLGLEDARLMNSYPHQLSGGQRQRVLIAQGLMSRHALLICDEPVANLDAVTARRTLQIIDEYLRKTGAALLVASHREDVFAQLGCRVHRMTPESEVEARPAESLLRDREVLVAKDVSKTYFVRDFLLRRRPSILALTRVSLSVRAGEMVAIVGPSGAGKSTLVRCLTGRERADRGTIDARSTHRAVQLVPQDASESLNPRVTVLEAMREARADANMGCLPENWASRKTGELSTGQRARVAVARALAALDQGFAVLDESLSGLDVATANAVIGEIRAAQREKGIACLLIAHEESMVARVADRVIRMDQGRMVA